MKVSKSSVKKYEKILLYTAFCSSMFQNNGCQEEKRCNFAPS